VAGEMIEAIAVTLQDEIAAHKQQLRS